MNSYRIIKGFTPPFELNFTSSAPNWSLFKLYLEYILELSNPKVNHPISSLLSLIIQAEKLPGEIRFQTICICIESLIKSEFTDMNNDSNHNLTDIIQKLKKYIEDNVSDTKITKRLIGLLNSTFKMRPVDILRQLASKNLIGEELIKEWGKLRHPIIHGEKIDQNKLQEYLDHYYSSLMLFYQLIFIKIGYKGSYTDYSLSGWPRKQF